MRWEDVDRSLLPEAADAELLHGDNIRGVIFNKRHLHADLFSATQAHEKEHRRKRRSWNPRAVRAAIYAIVQVE